MKKHNPKNKAAHSARRKKAGQSGHSGYVLIELIAYIGIVSIILVILSNFVIDVTMNAAQAEITKEVQQNARLALSRMTQEIRTAKEIVDVEPETISIRNFEDQLVTFCLYDNELRYLVESSDCLSGSAMTSEQVKISELIIEQQSDLITIRLKVEQRNESARPERTDQIQLVSTVVPRPLLY
ncbi:MAG: hypothetical protein COT24_02680 [Candidatus Kerfeldbacteria bacterium CG08_land_8_20_14_0_20_40_16]|uniref:Type II secretion system protein n=1 Tax=Candidatus Kerfeldbacteria bacterium CG08_land_8_20_14_0_20_40_16 TaxID=2014244 RepID=A0A2H0YVT4_9BACT|nr:MAG: hypothetical protein COT24_02680 [Candidatus Kerfeldbacteria bacterium CG08_land_8_20_14_0_20_40_16]